jgi:tRNA-guanine family transglycosylase
LKEHLKDVQQQAMYCVVHGGIDKELRTQSVDYLTSLPFDGYGIGGSLGNGREELKDLLEWMMPLFDEGERRNKPRHLLGIADEESIRNAATKGIDTLDSAYPTRLGRHGTLCLETGTSGSRVANIVIRLVSRLMTSVNAVPASTTIALIFGTCSRRTNQWLFRWLQFTISNT